MESGHRRVGHIGSDDYSPSLRHYIKTLMALDLPTPKLQGLQQEVKREKRAATVLTVNEFSVTPLTPSSFCERCASSCKQNVFRLINYITAQPNNIPLYTLHLHHNSCNYVLGFT